MEIISIKINKPLFSNFCYVRASLIDEAIRKNAKLEITIPKGKAIVNPIEWKKTGKIMRKVFKYENNPLVLIGNNVNLELQLNKLF